MLSSTVSFEHSFRKHYTALVKTAARILGNTTAAEDVVQETFIALWEKRNELQQIENEAAYLHRVVMNRALNSLRSQKKFVTDEALLENETENFFLPDEILQHKELQQKADAVINALPEAARVVFVLNRFENKSYKEIAEDLGISIKAVEKSMSRALKILRAHLPLILLWMKNIF